MNFTRTEEEAMKAWAHALMEGFPLVCFKERLGFGLLTYDLASRGRKLNAECLGRVKTWFENISKFYEENRGACQVHGREFRATPSYGFVFLLNDDAIAMGSDLVSILGEEDNLEMHSEELPEGYQPWAKWPKMSDMSVMV